MSNKELQNYLSQLPDDMEVLINRNGAIFTKCDKPITRYMGTSQKNVLF